MEGKLTLGCTLAVRSKCLQCADFNTQKSYNTASMEKNKTNTFAEFAEDCLDFAGISREQGFPFSVLTQNQNLI